MAVSILDVAKKASLSCETILEVLKANAGTANAVLAAAVPRIDGARRCSCREALRFAVLTRREDVPEPARRRLSLLMEKYWR